MEERDNNRKQKKKRMGKRSIFSKILFPMMLVTILQTLIFCSLIIFGGTISHLNKNSANTLHEKAEHSAGTLQNDMLTRWGNMEVFLSAFEKKYEEFLNVNQITGEEFNAEAKWQKQFLSEISSELIQLLRQNKVNGVFLILNGQDGIDPPQQGESMIKQGLHIRDLDQDAGYLRNDDLFLSISPASINEQLGIPLDSNWEGSFCFTSQSEADFYYNPLKTAMLYSHAGWEDQGYWAPSHRLRKGDTAVISYSIPLMDKQGAIIGVVGIEILESYLKKSLPYTELSDAGVGEYIIGLRTQEDMYHLVITNGYPYHASSDKENVVRFEDAKRDGFQKLVHQGDNTVFASINPIKLYSNNTLFEEEQWVVIALLNQRELYKFSSDIERVLFTTTAISVCLALGGVLLVSHLFADPIQTLSDIVERVKPGEKLNLKRTKIAEIDQFVEKIENLQNVVLESNQKLSAIIRLAEIPISAFEIDERQKTVFLTDSFFEILGCEITQEEKSHVQEFDFFMEKLRSREDSVIEREISGSKKMMVYHFFRADGQEKWVRMQTIFSDNKILGIVLDVTHDYIERIKLQHERDHDLLTDLLNRRAFRMKMEELFAASEELKIAAILMIDLDNLKYVNDTYGHDYGDDYIKGAADSLKECEDEYMLVSRMSGDEFQVLLYHYEKREELSRKLSAILQHTRQKRVKLKGEDISIRMSGGIAWYPKDSSDYEELMHYADFAMYQSKRSTKGEFHEFDWMEYERDSFLLTNRGELNTLIEEEKVVYHFQPIVNALDGSIYGYEALIRPKSELIRRPDELLLLAKAQGRLYHIEKLTWKKALESFRTYTAKIPDTCKIFINSISNQVLSDRDFREIEEKHGDILDRVVLELTEEERLNNEFTEKKLKFIEKWGAYLAIDDFGSGYNGENLLLKLNPNFIKVDMNIIRNIDKDENRQIMFQNLLNYTKSRQIKVIAEGVETLEELEYVREGGADYIQGYLIGKPMECPQKIQEQVREYFKGFA